MVLVHDSPRYLEHPAIQRYYHVVFQMGELAALRPRGGAIKEAVGRWVSPVLFPPPWCGVSPCGCVVAGPPSGSLLRVAACFDG